MPKDNSKRKYSGVGGNQKSGAKPVKKLGREKKQCQLCGAWFAYNPKIPWKKYCSKECLKKATAEGRKTDYPAGSPESLNRPYTDDTIYLIHKWHKEGIKVEEIAELLMRSEENVQVALQSPLTRGQEKAISEYLLPIKTSHRGTQGEK